MKVCVAYLGMENPYIGDGIGSIKSACVCVSEWVRERERVNLMYIFIYLG